MSSTGNSPSPPTTAAIRRPSELLNHAADASKPCDLNSSSRWCSNARRRESSLIPVLPQDRADTYCPLGSQPRIRKCRYGAPAAPVGRRSVRAFGARPWDSDRAR
jgi:hypothetical protein